MHAENVDFGNEADTGARGTRGAGTRGATLHTSTYTRLSTASRDRVDHDEDLKVLKALG